MPDLIDAGRLGLGLAFGVALLQLLLGLSGVVRRTPELTRSAANAASVQAALLTVAVAVLATGFLARDFSIQFVADHSSSAMPVGLTLAALWGGQEGSLLFWTWAMSLFAAVATRRMLAADSLIGPHGIVVLSGLQLFFLGVLVFTSSPFARLVAAPAEGRGLNPLLWDSGMQIHPPMLLAGYMSFGIPFAFAAGLLTAGRVTQPWLREMRNWMLLAWAIQSAGLLLGAWWAYRVLGWGGYWGWDPVENVALLPWLVATAYLHSALAQERRGQLRAWAIGLVLVSYALAIFGTFVVRSGVLSSVHNFALSDVGPIFFVFVGALLILSAALFIYRLPLIRSDEPITAVASKEAGFLINNLLMLAIAAATFWGTVFPLVTEIVQGARIAVGPPFYTQVNVPLLVATLALLATWPLLAWRRTSPRAAWRATRWPIATLVAVSVVLAVLGMRDGLPIVAIGLTAAVSVGVALEYARSVRAGLARRRETTTGPYPLFVGSRRRLGSYLVHLGIAVLALGIIASAAFSQETAATVERGQAVSLGQYDVVFQGLRSSVQPGLNTVVADVEVVRDGSIIDRLTPARRIHAGWENQPTADVAVSTTLPQLDDVYVLLSSWDRGGESATIRVLVNPLIVLLWIGGIVYFIGILIIAWPAERRDPVAVSATAPQPAGS
jgi:cytochrome c-type biogenesis protein CcmF